MHPTILNSMVANIANIYCTLYVLLHYFSVLRWTSTACPVLTSYRNKEITLSNKQQSSSQYYNTTTNYRLLARNPTQKDDKQLGPLREQPDVLLHSTMWGYIKVPVVTAKEVCTLHVTTWRCCIERKSFTPLFVVFCRHSRSDRSIPPRVV